MRYMAKYNIGRAHLSPWIVDREGAETSLQVVGLSLRHRLISPGAGLRAW
jgi:hypothetical protein